MEILRAEQLTKSFGKKRVLQGVDLSLREGMAYALVGVNGAGKSTLIELLCGVRRPDSGCIRMQGQPLLHRTRAHRSAVGYMPQQGALFPDLTVRENLLYLGTIYEIEQPETRAAEIEQLCFLSSYAHTLWRRLSGGYRQLTSLAAAILHRPPLLILDEPTSAMDPLFRRQFWQIIHRLKEEGTTILVSTHHVEEIGECDRMLCLSGGHIVHEVAVSEMYEDGRFQSVDEVLAAYIFGEETASR